MRQGHIIIAQMRTGSSALNMAMNQLEGVRSYSEPFRPTSLLGRPVTPERLDRVFAEYQGFKHIVGEDKIDEDEFDIFERPEPKILLLRRNILQQAMSVQIAHLSKFWGVGGNDRVKTSEMGAADVERVRGWRDDLLALSVLLLKEAAIRKWPVYYYEDLYGIKTPWESRLALFRDIVDHFGYGPMGAEEEERAVQYLKPGNKTNSVETYNLIPNIKEIDQTLGSDTTGWLFDDCPSTVTGEAVPMVEQRKVWQKNVPTNPSEWYDDVTVFHFRGDQLFHDGRHEKAFELWMAGAKRGHYQCTRNVAWAYSAGIGVEKDPEEAAKWTAEADKIREE
jgi:hypothetical protein